jgi:signal peptidase II
MLKKVITGLVLVALTCLDQWTKWLTVTHIPLGGHKNFIKGLIGFTYLQNDGAAWSMLRGQMWVFWVITIVALGVAGYFLMKFWDKDVIYTTLITVIIAGILGNFIDRARLGYVVDMIQTEFMNFPIFNVADMYLSVGIILLYAKMLWDEWKESKKK